MRSFGLLLCSLVFLCLLYCSVFSCLLGLRVCCCVHCCCRVSYFGVLTATSSCFYGCVQSCVLCLYLCLPGVLPLLLCVTCLLCAAVSLCPLCHTVFGCVQLYIYIRPGMIHYQVPGTSMLLRQYRIPVVSYLPTWYDLWDSACRTYHG